MYITTMIQHIPANSHLLLQQYRPPGRSNRSGRAQQNDDIFEGLPVKQWSQSTTHVSLAPPKTEAEKASDDKWGEPPMPRDYQLLQPWTQHLLRLARSGKVGTKRKQATAATGHDPDSMDEERAEDGDGAEESNENLGERGFVARKWRLVPESLLEPEHRHFEFLAKRRKGLPSLYAPQAQTGAAVVMRKTKVQKTGPDGEVAVYEVLVPEGQTVDGEVSESTELAAVTPVVAAPGTVIEGVGIANDEGVVVAEHLKPAAAPRRNRPPPKKKGGPGRGKKRVTFTNADGTTYTTVVPNATKIVPQPGQTVKHVAKGEEAIADITAEQAAARAAENPDEGEGEEGEEGEGSDEGDDEGDDDDDREEGELSEEDAPTGGVTPVPQEKKASVEEDAVLPTEDAVMQDAPPPSTTSPTAIIPPKAREASSSPELPLAKTSHSRQSSLTKVPILAAETTPAPPAQEEEQSATTPPTLEADAVISIEPTEAAQEATVTTVVPVDIVVAATPEPVLEIPASVEAPEQTVPEPQETTEEGEAEEDLLGNLEKSLEGDGQQG